MKFISTKPDDGLMKLGPMFFYPSEDWECVGIANADIVTKHEGVVFKTPSGKFLMVSDGKVHILDSQVVRAALCEAKGQSFFERHVACSPPNAECMDCNETSNDCCQKCEVNNETRNDR